MPATKKAPSIKKLNEGLESYLITGGGKEAPAGFKDKPLKIEQVAKVKGVPISHRFSDAYNPAISLVRFYVHVSQAGDNAPILWLSRKQYKTCRAGHSYFQLLPMEACDGGFVAVWRTMTFRLPARGAHIQVEAVNDTDAYDLWAGVDAKSKKATKLPLTVGK